MSDRLKLALLHAARAFGMFRLARWLTRRRLRILCYHGAWLEPRRPNPYNFLFICPERFGRRLRAMRDAGYHVLPLDEALSRLRGGTLPPDSVVLTIDDGWYGTATSMVPLLVQHGMAATLYLTTHHVAKGTTVFGVALRHILTTAPVRRVDPRRLPGLPVGPTGVDLDDAAAREALFERLLAHAAGLPAGEAHEGLLGQVASALGYDWEGTRAGRQFGLMSRDEARRCAEAGIDLQLHTHRHRIARRGVSCLPEEIADNRRELARITSRPATHFCYPSGHWHAGCFEELAAAGISSATTTELGLCTEHSHPMALPRILDGNHVSDIEFDAELAGFMELGRQLRRLPGTVGRHSQSDATPRTNQ